MIRSDNEQALLQAVDKALVALTAKGVTSISKGSVPYDPQTNGLPRECRPIPEGISTSEPIEFRETDPSQNPT